MDSNNQCGKVDLLNLSAVGFLVLSLGTAVYFTASPQIQQFVTSFAAKKGKTAEDYGSPAKRQAARIAEGTSTTGKKGDVPIPVTPVVDTTVTGQQTTGTSNANSVGANVTSIGQALSNLNSPTTTGTNPAPVQPISGGKTITGSIESLIGQQTTGTGTSNAKSVGTNVTGIGQALSGITGTQVTAPNQVVVNSGKSLNGALETLPLTAQDYYNVAIDRTQGTVGHSSLTKVIAACSAATNTNCTYGPDTQNFSMSQLKTQDPTAYNQALPYYNPYNNPALKQYYDPSKPLNNSSNIPSDYMNPPSFPITAGTSNAKSVGTDTTRIGQSLNNLQVSTQPTIADAINGVVTRVLNVIYNPTLTNIKTNIDAILNPTAPGSTGGRSLSGALETLPITAQDYYNVAVITNTKADSISTPKVIAACSAATNTKCEDNNALRNFSLDQLKTQNPAAYNQALPYYNPYNDPQLGNYDPTKPINSPNTPPNYYNPPPFPATAGTSNVNSVGGNTTNIGQSLNSAQESTQPTLTSTINGVATRVANVIYNPSLTNIVTNISAILNPTTPGSTGGRSLNGSVQSLNGLQTSGNGSATTVGAGVSAGSVQNSLDRIVNPPTITEQINGTIARIANVINNPTPTNFLTNMNAILNPMTPGDTGGKSLSGALQTLNGQQTTGNGSANAAGISNGTPINLSDTTQNTTIFQKIGSAVQTIVNTLIPNGSSVPQTQKDLPKSLQAVATLNNETPNISVNTPSKITNPNASSQASNLENFSVFLQYGVDDTQTINNFGISENIKINNYKSTLLKWGCGPATAYNVLRLEGYNVTFQQVLDSYLWTGAGSSGDAVLLNLKRNGFPANTVDYGVNNRITNANQLTSYTGVLVYEGMVHEGQSKSIDHIASFDCNQGSCYSVDSYFSKGNPIKCNVESSAMLNCGGVKYQVGETKGSPNAFYPVQQP